jgi:hypothetical protein
MLRIQDISFQAALICFSLKAVSDNLPRRSLKFTKVRVRKTPEKGKHIQTGW